MNAAIATKLNVLESAIVRVEEWAHVLFVVVRGIGARFVSKKIMTTTELTAEQLVAVGGNRWQKNGYDRVYFNIAEFVTLSNSKARKLAGVKLFWEDGEFRHTNASTTDEIKAAVREIRSRAEGIKVSAAPQPFPNAMITSDGRWVTPDQWDEIEGDM